MPIQDRHIPWLRKKHKVHWTDFGITTVAIQESGTTSWLTGAAFASVHAGAAITKEIGTLGYVGLLLDTAADTVCAFFHVPADLDPTFPIGFAVRFATGSVAGVGDTLTWKVFADWIAEDAQLVTGTTVMDTVVAADAAATLAYALQTSSRGIVNADTITRQNVEDGYMCCVAVELDAIHTGLAEDVFFLELVMDYSPHKTEGTGKTFDAPIQG